MFRSRKFWPDHTPTRPAPRPRQPRLGVEHLETREVPAGLFIQGQAYTDTNANGVLDGTESPLAGAKIQLRDSSGNPIPGVPVKTTLANGLFRFTDADFPTASYPNGMPSGTYQVVETPPSGYVNTGSDASHWNLGTATAAINTVTVTVSDQTVTMQSWTTGNVQTVSPITFPDTSVAPPDPNAQWSVEAGELLLAMQGGAYQTPKNDVLAYCVDFNDDLQDGPVNVTPTGSPPSGPTLAPDAQEIAYLYNHFGVYGFSTQSPALVQLYAANPGLAPFNPGQDAAAFQVALWELSHDGVGPTSPPNLSTGTFKYTGPDAALIAKANAFLSAAQAAHAPGAPTELAIYLDGPNSVLTSNPNTPAPTQWTVTGGMLTFGNALGISGTKYLDVSGNGLNTTAGPNSPADTPLAGVTIYLDTNPNGKLDPGERSTTTGPDGTYTFAGLAAGTYVVREVVPTGYVSTGAACWTVTVQPGTNSTGKDFANAETCEASTVYNVCFTIVHCDGTTQTVTDLRGNTREGDVITAKFYVKAPVGETSHQVSFASYTAPEPYFNANTASQQQIYDLATGDFKTGGPYTLTIHVPTCYYQVDLVCGYAIDKLGPAGSNIFYSAQSRLESADNGGTHACCDNTGSISGYKFNDKNGDGDWDSGEPALPNWTIYVDKNNNGCLDAGELAAVTDANGYYKINNVPAGSWTLREVQQSGWYASKTPGVVTVPMGGDVTGKNFGNYKTATVSGYKFNDKNGDGYWDKNGLDNCSGTSDDEVGLSGWKVFVDYDGDGVLDAGEPSATTDASGAYTITGVKPGTWAVEEVMQSGWVRSTDDACVTVTSGGSASGVNIGNFKGGLVMEGDTATIGFWNGPNGQKLINCLNGGSTAKNLGNWLASTFPKLYGSQAGSANNLTGKTNAQVAAYFQSLFNMGGPKLEAQVLATALAVYVTDSDRAGTAAAKYGFTVNTTGVGGDYYNIGDNGAAFGVTNDSVMTVLQILNATNARAVNGVLWGTNTTYRNMGNVVYSGINQDGDITS